ncbi:class I SAM-dependent methyltransferase [Streptomyces violascens]|uniref:class I SAM-dependent methyltransferase n=1 Tax=Streptomyces violascens TaxID=67381 RepID=UPI00378F616D
MRRKGRVFDQFEPAARSTLAFLTDELGFDRPLLSMDLLRTLTYSRGQQEIQVHYDLRGNGLFTYVTTVFQGVEYWASLSNLVFAAGLGHRNAVTTSANNLRMMDKSLESQAHYLRLLAPTLQEPAEAAELMRRAGAKQRAVGGDLPGAGRARSLWQGRAMPFDHNDHYHRLLLRQVPPNCRTALDVGCGTGRFARRLAGLGIEVDAIDPSGEVIAEAIAEARAMATGPAPGDRGPRFRRADVTKVRLPKARYDFISCLASVHHMPFGTVAALRDALAPGGVLVILGCYPERTRLDWAWSLAAVPVNAVVRLAVFVRDKLGSGATGRTQVQAPVAQPTMPLPQIRREAATLLPGCRIRRLLFWRYLLVFRKGG